MSDTNLLALVVEDESGWQQILSEILTDAGLTVTVVDNVKAAVTELRSHPHRLAIIDLSLDAKDHRNQEGLHVLDAVSRYDPGCSALLLTGYATVELAVDAVTRRGAYTCLRKETFQRTHFRKVVHQALTRAPFQTSPPQAPTKQASAAAPMTQKGSGHSAPSGGLALVVEDDVGWRSVLSELLVETGYQVRLCNGFGEALGWLGRERFSLAVIDLSLSGPDAASTNPWGESAEPDTSEGYRLLTSTQAAGIPTVLVSGVASPSEIERAYDEYGVFACLQKRTFDRQAFHRTIDVLRDSQEMVGDLGYLTEREAQVLKLLSRGMTNQEIAARLMISTNTVKRHLKAVFGKLGVHTRAAAVAKAISLGVSSGWVADQSEDPHR